MKKILIDDIVNENENGCGVQSQFQVNVDSNIFSGSQIAKPLNYSELTKYDRLKMAHLVIKGEAIAVSYFKDLTPEEQADYVRNKLQ